MEEIPLEEVKQSRRRPIKLLMILLAAVVLVGCGVQQTGNNPGVSAEGDRVYVAYGTSVYAVDVVAQREIWRFPAGGGNTEYYAAPSIGEDRIILGDAGASQGFLSPGVVASAYAVNDVDSGSPTSIWQTTEKLARDRIVAEALQANGQVFIGTADNDLVALDGNSGSEQWRTELGHSVWGRPAFVNGNVVVGSMDKSVYGLDAATGDINWQQELGGAIAANIVADGSTVYVGSFDSHLYAFDGATGDEIFSAEATDWIWGAPSLGNGMVFVGDASGEVIAVDQDNGAQQWSTSVGGVIEAGVMALGDTVYVPVVVPTESASVTTGRLVAINADTGVVRWQVDKVNPFAATPLAAGGFIVVSYVNDDNGVVLDVFDADGKQVWSYTPVEQ